MVATESMESFIPSLAKSLRSGGAPWVVFLGAGASMSCAKPGCDVSPGLASTTELIAAIQRAMPGHQPREGVTLMGVAEEYLSSAHGGRAELEALLADRLMIACEPRPIHHLIARCPQIRYVITTNYDNLLETAMASAGRPYKRHVHHQFKSNSGIFDVSILGDSASVMLHKMHGSVDEAGSLVISETDYIRYIANMTNNERGMPQLIRESILGQGRVLFLGYGLRDWDLRIVIECLLGNRLATAPYSFALARSESGLDAQYWAERKVRLIYGDIATFAVRLAEEMGVSIP